MSAENTQTTAAQIEAKAYVLHTKAMNDFREAGGKGNPPAWSDALAAARKEIARPTTPASTPPPEPQKPN